MSNTANHSHNAPQCCKDQQVAMISLPFSMMRSPGPPFWCSRGWALFQGWVFAHALSPTSLPYTQPFLIQVPQFEMSQIQASQVPGQFLVRFPCPLYNLELPIHLLFSLLLSPGEQGTPTSCSELNSRCLSWCPQLQSKSKSSVSLVV